METLLNVIEGTLPEMKRVSRGMVERGKSNFVYLLEDGKHPVRIDVAEGPSEIDVQVWGKVEIEHDNLAEQTLQRLRYGKMINAIKTYYSVQGVNKKIKHSKMLITNDILFHQMQTPTYLDDQKNDFVQIFDRTKKDDKSPIGRISLYGAEGQALAMKLAEWGLIEDLALSNVAGIFYVNAEKRQYLVQELVKKGYIIHDLIQV